MYLLKTIARRIVLPTIQHLGIERLFSRFSNVDTVILCLHGVSKSTNFKINNRHMPVEEFEKLIAYLAKHFEIIPIEKINEKPLTKNSKKRVCLTFDDGYLNNFETALPVLEKYKAPATFFILTKGLQETTFMAWADVLDLFLFGYTKDSIQLNQFHFKRESNRFVCFERNNQSIHEYLKLLGEEKYFHLEQLINKQPDFKANCIKYKDYWKLVHSEDLKKYALNSYVSIGSHTVHHLNLSETPLETVSKELHDSKMELEKLLDLKIDTIAYPDGSYNEAVKNIAETVGYQMQFAVDFKSPSIDDLDTRIYPRFSISNSTTWQSNIIRLNLQFSKYGIRN